MAIATVDALIAALPGQQLTFTKTATAGLTIGQWYSPWLLAGKPGAGAAPSVGVNGEVPTDATAGGMPFTNPASGKTYIARLTHYPDRAGILIVYDRLWQNSGLSATLTTSQAITPVALPSRCPVKTDPTGETFDALGHTVEAWFDVMTTMGVNTVDPTITYTDEAGNAGATGTMMGRVSAPLVGRCFPFTLAAGDTGVRSIQAYQSTATMTSGTFSLVLRRRLATIIASTASLGNALDWAGVGFPVVPDDACIDLMWIPNVTNAVALQGEILLAQG